MTEQSLPSVTVVTCYEPHVSGLEITVPGGEPIFAVPFREHDIDFAMALSIDEILVCGKHATAGGLRRIGIYSTTRQQIIRSALIPNFATHMLSRDRGKLYTNALGILCVIDLATLTAGPLFKGVIWRDQEGRLTDCTEFFVIDEKIKDRDARVFHSEKHRIAFEELCDRAMNSIRQFLNESSDGRIIVDANRQIGMGSGASTQFSIWFINPDDWTIKRIPHPSINAPHSSQPYWVYDPKSEYCARTTADQMPFAIGKGSQPHHAYGASLDQASGHPDLQDDSRKRYGLILELQKIDQSYPPIRCIARMFAIDQLGLHPSNHTAHAQALEFQAIWRANGRQPAIFDRRPTEWSDTLGINVDPVRTVDVDRTLNSCVLRITPDPDGGSFWLLFRDDKVRNITIDGTVGPLIDRRDLSLAEVLWPSSVAFSERFNAFAKSTFINRITVESWSSGAVNDALLSLAAQIERDIRSLHLRESLNFEFRVSDTIVSEKDFFDRLASQHPYAGRALRTLLSAFNAAVSEQLMGQMPWTSGENGWSALCFALRAAVCSDEEARDVFRGYLALRDGEHENYCLGVVLPGYIARWGWSDAHAVRFGIFALLNAMWGTFNQSREHYPAGLMSAAAKFMKPDEFVDALCEEVAGLKMPPQWRDQSEAWYLAGVGGTLDKNDPFEKAVATELARRRPDILRSSED